MFYLQDTHKIFIQPTSNENLADFIESLPSDDNNSMIFQNVTYAQVMNEILNLRSDCCSGYDNIPVKFIKSPRVLIASTKS